MKKLAFALLRRLPLPSFLCCDQLYARSKAPRPAAKRRKTLKSLPLARFTPACAAWPTPCFEGVKPEAMDVEVLGVLHNVNGPKGDIILVRLHGQKVEYTGVVAGMSGSPVYFDGKLAGALAFRIGEFSKEPIAGVTPIADMLEISALDRSPAEETAAVKPAMNAVAGKTAAPGGILELPESVRIP